MATIGLSTATARDGSRPSSAAQERLIVAASVLDLISNSARSCYPDEVAGAIASARGVIVGAIALGRGARDRVRALKGHFTETGERFAREGMIFAGTFHSHPRTRAYPSEVDRLRMRAGELMIIAAVRMGEVRAYRQAPGGRLVEFFIEEQRR